MYINIYLLSIPVAITIAIVGIIVLNPKAADGWYKYRCMPKKIGPSEDNVKTTLLDKKISFSDRYYCLFRYFLRGYVDYMSAGCSRIQYPGLPSVRGYKINGLEGFARTAPLLGAWIYSGRDRYCTPHGSDEPVDLIALVSRGILAGTDPNSEGFWGEITNNDQRIVEAADIARLVWLTRRQIWDKLTAEEREQICRWLEQALVAEIHQRNNWILFPVVVDCVLFGLGFRSHVDFRNYYEFKKNYLESGWFYDHPEGVDYYNTWGITYDLFWIHLLCPNVDSHFLRASIEESGRLTEHLIGPEGIPIMGRSVCYRTAVPVPVLASALTLGTEEKKGIARSALDNTWQFFIKNDVLRSGTITQGYFECDPRLLDAYSGAGSSHWGLRSLTLAFMADPSDYLWSGVSLPLPIELNDFELTFKKLGWTITGDKEKSEITILIHKNTYDYAKIAPQTRFQRTVEQIIRKPRRPANHQVKYELRRYSSRKPFPLSSD